MHPVQVHGLRRSGPVDCFYVGGNMLVIHPDECIDCGVCEPECPVEAIIPDTDGEAEKWLELNRDYSEKWPNITRKGSSPDDADTYKDEEGKFEKYFDEAPKKPKRRRSYRPRLRSDRYAARAVTTLNCVVFLR